MSCKFHEEPTNGLSFCQLPCLRFSWAPSSPKHGIDPTKVPALQTKQRYPPPGKCEVPAGSEYIYLGLEAHAPQAVEVHRRVLEIVGRLSPAGIGSSLLSTNQANHIAFCWGLFSSQAKSVDKTNNTSNTRSNSVWVRPERRKHYYELWSPSFSVTLEQVLPYKFTWEHKSAHF